MALDQLLIAAVRAALAEDSVHPSALCRRIPNLRRGAALALSERLRTIRLARNDTPLYRERQVEDVLAVLMRHERLPEHPADLEHVVRQVRADAARRGMAQVNANMAARPAGRRR